MAVNNEDNSTVIHLTVGRLREIVEDAYQRCGYRLIDFGREEGKGVLNCPKKTILLVNTIQELILNEVP